MESSVYVRSSTEQTLERFFAAIGRMLDGSFQGSLMKWRSFFIDERVDVKRSISGISLIY